MHERDISEKFLASGVVDGAIELKNDREKAIWDRAQADAQEFLRGVSVRQGYGARGVRLPPLVPAFEEVEIFHRRALIAMGPFSIAEADIYARSFKLGCETGYPPRNN